MKNELLNCFLPYQQRWLRDTSPFKIGLWARQTGKDYTCAAEAVLDCLQHPHRHWLILACGERQARESLEQARHWAHWARSACNAPLPLPSHSATSFPGVARGSCRASSSVRILRDAAHELRFDNGSRITALPARPQTIRGYSANLILTEFAFHDQPGAIWKAIFPSVSNPLRGGPKKVRIISTPNGQGNYFHNLWTGSKIFSRHKITIHDARSHGLPIDLSLLKDGLLDPEAWAQEYECQFVDQSSVLLPYELIEQCESPEATQTSSPHELSTRTGDLFLGIDFGRKHDLTVAWTLEKLPSSIQNHPSSSSALTSSSFLTREVLILQRTPTPAQLDALLPRARRARRICVDYTGAGIGLGDSLAHHFGAARNAADWTGKVELCSFTPALKEEIFVKLRAAFERQKIWIPPASEIREDLHSMHRVVSPSGQITFRASLNPDGHSDRSCALALALRAAETAPITACASIVGRKSPLYR